MLLALLLFFAGADASPVSLEPRAIATSTSSAPSDALDRFRAWFDRLRKGKETIDSRSADDVRATLGELKTAWEHETARGNELSCALLDFVGWSDSLPASSGSSRGPDTAGLGREAHDFALGALRSRTDPEFQRWLTREVLAVTAQPVERRLAALSVLSKQTKTSFLLPLLSCAREDEPRLRVAAMNELVGWNDPSVHTFFLDELARGFDGTHGADGTRGAATWLAESHFASVALPPRGPHAKRLLELVERGLASADWREVSRAIALSKPLDPEPVISYLIEAMRQWKARDESGGQSLRIEMEILRALERRSGRKFGLSPADWSTWWKAVRGGAIQGDGPRTGQYHEGTNPAFFGIHPATDRVTFVIDRSGSMDTPMKVSTGDASAGPRSRWQAAVAEMLGFLDAIGPKARFNVLFFSDHTEEWRPTLVPADDEDKKAVRAWLDGQRPGGGTRLQSAIARAMRLGPDGMPDFAVLEADTVIVLCDGETEEGPGWIESFLRTANQRARVVFHCVRIGAAGDGSLEKLAGGSGGDFVRVDG